MQQRAGGGFVTPFRRRTTHHRIPRMQKCALSVSLHSHLIHFLRRRETVRKQRIESEQRRRDELSEGYSRLKESLPPSNQKASKVSLLERGSLSPFPVVNTSY